MKFQPIPNFDSLSPQTTKGDLISRSTTTAVRVAVGSDGQVLTADSTQSSGVKWAAASSGSAYNVVSKTGTYSAVANDYIYASSSSFTITLPTAVGISGQSIAIEHAGTSLTQVYTLNTTSSQTIGGIASGSYALYTNGEVLIVVSDGANWRIASHKAATDWVDGGTITITGTTTNPTKGTTTRDKIWWKRIGSEMFIRIEFASSGAGTAGSGDYLYLLPATANTTSQLVYTTIGVNNGTTVPSSLGSCTAGNSATAGGGGNVVLYDSTHVRFFIAQGTSYSPTGSAYFPFNGTIALSAAFSFAVSGWQP